MNFLPFLTGERTPNWPDSYGVLTGLRPGSLRPGSVYRAALEGATYPLLYGKILFSYVRESYHVSLSARNRFRSFEASHDILDNLWKNVKIHKLDCSFRSYRYSKATLLLKALVCNIFIVRTSLLTITDLVQKVSCRMQYFFLLHYHFHLME